MANLEILTVGARVYYHTSATAAAPTSAGTLLKHINSAPDVDLEPDMIDVSDTEDYITRYRAGRQDPGGDKVFQLNHTDESITMWNTMVTAYNASKATKPYLIFEYWYPGAAKSFFWIGDPASLLGSNGIEQNSLSTIPAHVACMGVIGYANRTANS